jgi:hypothetical protein
MQTLGISNDPCDYINCEEFRENLKNALVPLVDDFSKNPCNFLDCKTLSSKLIEEFVNPHLGTIYFYSFIFLLCVVLSVLVANFMTIQLIRYLRNRKNSRVRQCIYLDDNNHIKPYTYD